MIKFLFYSLRKQTLLVPKINYNFIFGKVLKKNKQQSIKQLKQQEQEEEDKNSKLRQIDDDEPEDFYDFFQRQKQIQMSRDFRKLKKQNQSAIIPDDIGKGGFDELVYWSQQAKTPQKILELIKKFNKSKIPKKIEDKVNFNHFKANVEATVYLANSYLSLTEYALFGYKFQILDPSYWLKIQEKILRKVPSNDQEINQLVDIAFVMGSLKAGQYTYNTVQKLLKEKQLSIDQTTKLIICFFRAEKGQKQWLVKLLMNFTQKMDQANSQILESILPVIKQSRNIPDIFEQKLELRVKNIINELSLPAICVISSYFGFDKGGQTLWMSLQEKARTLLSQIKKQKKKLSTGTFARLIQGIMSSYKFSIQFVKQQILSPLEANNYERLTKLSACNLSTLAKCIYIYELQIEAQKMCDIIESIIMDKFSALNQVTPQELIHVLKDYAITRNGSRDLYKFLQKVVNNKLADITLQRHFIQKFVTIYEQSNLCSQQTLQMLKAFIL